MVSRHLNYIVIKEEESNESGREHGNRHVVQEAVSRVTDIVGSVQLDTKDHEPLKEGLGLRPCCVYPPKELKRQNTARYEKESLSLPVYYTGACW